MISMENILITVFVAAIVAFAVFMTSKHILTKPSDKNSHKIAPPSPEPEPPPEPKPEPPEVRKIWISAAQPHEGEKVFHDEFSQPARQEGTWSLTLQNGTATTIYCFTWQCGTITIGRNCNNSIVIDSSSISRTHCRLGNDGAKWFIEDFSSTNGTFLNGRRLPASILTELSAGDKIQLGMNGQYMIFDRCLDTDNI